MDLHSSQIFSVPHLTAGTRWHHLIADGGATVVHNNSRSVSMSTNHIRLMGSRSTSVSNGNIRAVVLRTISDYTRCNGYCPSIESHRSAMGSREISTVQWNCSCGGEISMGNFPLVHITVYNKMCECV